MNNKLNIKAFDETLLKNSIDSIYVSGLFVDENNNSLLASFNTNEFYESDSQVGQYILDISRYINKLKSNKKYKLYIQGLKTFIDDVQIIAISNSRYEIKLRSDDLNKNIEDGQLNNKYSLLFEGQDYIIINSYYDSYDDYIVIKLLQPLSQDIKEEYYCQIKEILFSKIELDVEISDELDYDSKQIDNLKFLHGQNLPTIDYQTQQYSYSDLITTSSFYSYSIEDLVKKLENDTQLNIDYSDFSNHVFFAFSEDILDTAYHKIRQIINLETMKQQVTANDLLPLFYTYENKQREIIYDMTGYEQYVYNTSWPRVNNSTGGLYHYTSSNVVQWYATQSISASLWDNNNNAQIYHNIPNYYFENDTNNVFYNYVHAMAMHYDYIKQHMDQFMNFININYDSHDIPPNNLLWLLGKYFGFTMYDGNSMKSLTNYLLGKEVSGSSSVTSLQNTTYNIWKRILNNLPYIYKTKGTQESIRALLNSYGIPADILQIDEYTVGQSYYETSSYETYYSPIKSSKYLKINENSYLKFVDLCQLMPGSSSDVWSDRTFELTYKTNYSFNGEQIFLSQHTTKDETLSLNFYPNYILYSYASGTGGTDSMIIPFSASNNTFTYICFGTMLSSSLPNKSGAFFRVIQYNDDLLVFNTGSNYTEINLSGFGLSTSTDDVMIGDYDTNGLSNFGIMEFRCWNRKLTEDEMLKHAYDFRSVALNTPLSNISESSERWNIQDLRARYKLDDKIDLNSNVYGLKNSAPNPIGYCEACNFVELPFATSSSYYWADITKNTKTFVPSISARRRDRKIRVCSGTIAPNVNDIPVINMEWSPTKVIDDDIIEYVADVDFNSILGDPKEYYSSSYALLDRYTKNYFNKYIHSYDFYKFMDLVTNVDKSLQKSIEQLIPARSQLNYGISIGSHIFERNRYNYNKGYIEERPYLTYSIDKTNIYSLGKSSNQKYLEPNVDLSEIDIINGFNSLSKFVQPYIENKIFSSSMTGSHLLYHNQFMYPYKEIYCSTYYGSTCNYFDGEHTSTAWITGDTYGAQLQVVQQ